MADMPCHTGGFGFKAGLVNRPAMDVNEPAPPTWQRGCAQAIVASPATCQMAICTIAATPAGLVPHTARGPG